MFKKNFFKKNNNREILNSSLMQLSNIIPGYVFWKDLHGRFLGSNDVHLKALGLEKLEQLIGHDDFEFYPENVALTCRSYDEKAIKEKKIINLGEEVKNKAGLEEIWITSKAPLYDQDKKIIGVIGVSIDITEEKRKEQLVHDQILRLEKLAKEKAELETKFLQQELEQKKRLGEITAQVAHDIRSPLSALQVLAEQGLKEVSEPNRIMLRDAVKQIQDIVNNLDQKSQQKSLALTQIAALLEQVLLEKRVELSGKSISLYEEFSDNAYGLFVEVSSSDIKRVISNIINNAVEATKGNSVINVALSQDGDKIVIAISDNGQGIPQHIIEKLCQHGFTTKKTGHGLGLFHAKETLQNLGGNIELTSIEGEGTTVYLQLPAYAAPKWSIQKLFLPKNMIFVCVDDSVSVLNIWQDRLSRLNSQIDLRYCKNKNELLLELGKENLNHCAYFVDYEFSGESYTGLDLIKQIMTYKKNDDEIYLVTSHSFEKSLQSFCIKHNIFMIPKIFTLKIPIEIV